MWALLPVLLGGCAGEVPPVARLAVAAPVDFELGYPQEKEVRLSWQPLTDLDADVNAQPHAFVHLLDADGRLVRTFDHPLPAPWVVGETIEYDLVLSQSAMAPPLAAGTYDLVGGLYDPAAGERWALELDGEESRRQAYRWMQVQVPQADLGPTLDYRGAWAPVTAGTDQQVLASRGLRGAGDVHLSGIGDRGGRLSLRLWLPAAADASQQIRFLGEETTQRLSAVSSCGGAEVAVTGSGFHELSIAVDPTAQEPPAEGASAAPQPAAPQPAAPEPAGEGCAVTLTPNFILVTQGDPQPLAARLHGLYWQAGREASPPPSDGDVPRVY
ncbi:MAG: hypothetical protein AAF481_12000 [Acidobacteriota bacterium]